MRQKQPSWTHTLQAITEAKQSLRCLSCKKFTDEIYSFPMCIHSFCQDCIDFTDTFCPSCQEPCQASEIKPNRIMNTFSEGLKVLLEITEQKNNSPIDNISPTVAKSPEIPKEKSSNQTVVITPKKLVQSTATKGRKSTRGRRTSVNYKVSKKSCQDFFAKAEDISSKHSTTPEKRRSRETSETPTKAIAEGFKRPITTPSWKLGSNKPGPALKKNTAATNIEKSPGTDNESFSAKTSSSGNSENKFATPGRKKKESGINRQNVKGETPLHTACIRGDSRRVIELLAAGANPNIKDNAGWTPLHEATNHGFVEIVELLLKAKALVNIPGPENITPLHEAVSGDCIPIARLLMAYGADVNFRSSSGLTPMAASKEEIRQVLLNTEKEVDDEEFGQESSLCVKDSVFYGSSDLLPEEKSLLSAICEKIGAKAVPNFGSEVTHVIAASLVDQTDAGVPSFDLLCALAKGTWTLTRDWLNVSEMSDSVVEFSSFELLGIAGFYVPNSFTRSRVNSLKQLPRLFDGCHFFLYPNCGYKIGNSELSKEQLSTLIKFGGGVVLSREPNPESIPQWERTVPFHATQNSSLAHTSHFILYRVGKTEPQIKYNMRHIKTFSTEWFIQCILSWELLET